VDPFERLPIFTARSHEDGRPEPQLVDQPERREAEELDGVRHRVELPVRVEPGASFDPPHVRFEIELF
jgi:hypothetical protein